MNKRVDFTEKQEERIQEVYDKSREYLEFLFEKPYGGKETLSDSDVSFLTDIICEELSRVGRDVYFPTRTTNDDNEVTIDDYFW